MEQAVEKARKAWESAPAHVRMMAGAYVDPMIVALLELAYEIKRAELRADTLSVAVGKLILESEAKREAGQ